MDIPSIKSKLPDALEFKDIVLEPPTANMPVFPPIVIPPGNIKAPEGIELEEIPAETEEEETVTTEQPTLRVPVVKIDLPLPSAEVVATATYAAVAAVATTTLATPLFDKLKKQIQKLLQKKVEKWKENRQKKRDSSKNLKME